MPESLWKKVTGPSAGLVKRHYVEQRTEALRRRNPTLEDRIAKALQEELPAGTLKRGDDWMEVYRKITGNLQKAPLTINFNASSWFASENHYESYAQVYALSGLSAEGTGQLISSGLNPALTRAAVDDRVTFAGLRGNHAPSQPRRGLMPGRQGIDRVRTQMEFRAGSALRTAPDPKDPTKTVTYADSTNPHFNPKTKQVFTALNYGRRNNGSSTMYGDSHFVLNPKFKLNALYFAGDTFNPGMNGAVQASYPTLGSLVAFANPLMRKSIVQSCYFGAVLSDTSSTGLLLEAHVFEDLTFTGNIEEIRLRATPGTAEYENARKFARKHGAKLVLVGAPSAGFY